MEKVDFTFSLSMLNQLSGTLITISRILQSEKLDLIQCCREVAMLRRRLSTIRETELIFERTFNDAMMSTKCFEMLLEV